ncbi:hypothetical protein CXB51_008011 [Gossypium anomalum]|uniref:Uncharacterized protein n=1 Tax=Gossypium anomalum TaxID=47600 RepID=A0A8J5ZJ61_9ROSI|nr:hypothetical protein CXB51_008011 [Gossypium anomalum]
MDSLCGSSGNGENLPGDLNTKKVHFKDLKTILDVEMVAESTSAPTLSWKDMVLGKVFTESKESSIVHSTNGASPFLKLLGMNIGVVALQNKVYRL